MASQKGAMVLKRRGSWNEDGEDPGTSTDPVSGGRSWRSESCMETNAWDVQGPWPVVPEAGGCKWLHNEPKGLSA